MSNRDRLEIATKAIRQLGPRQVGLYGLYQLGLRTGHYERVLKSSLTKLEKTELDLFNPLFLCLPSLPSRSHMREQLGADLGLVFKEADEITHGYVRLFGGPSVPLELNPPKPLEKWSKYERNSNLINDQDIKFTWEVGRLGWVCKLAMAYYLSKDERYAESAWSLIEKFLSVNPAFLGPHWSSAQEVAIRLVSLAFASQVLTQSPQAKADRLEMIKKAISVHAERIRPTLPYARSQNNNHLLTEALGLYTASAVLPEHPQSPNWHALGWDWLNQALVEQIAPDGTYIQHSANYHRLMLQCALWAFIVHEYRYKDEPFQAEVLPRLQAATRWLWKLVDPETGKVPNLGHNDGAYILPLTVCPYEDYRPVVYAAARAFIQTNLLPKGPWNDMADWLSLPEGEIGMDSRLDSWREAPAKEDTGLQPPYIIVNHKNDSWASFCVTEFHSRPAHADQLHLDLWWRGHNITLDPGTYLYNAPAPWENSLASAFVHNTVTIDGQEPMQRVSRFLYLDWAQATVQTSKSSNKGGWESLSAIHDGYQKIGITHSRMVTTFRDGHWEVVDLLDGPSESVHSARLHWLLPDWNYEILQPATNTDTPVLGMRILSPNGWIGLKVSSPTTRWKESSPGFKFLVVRAGEILHGSGIVLPTMGWTSLKYGDKIPALAFIVEITQDLPIDLKSEFTFSGES